MAEDRQSGTPPTDPVPESVEAEIVNEEVLTPTGVGPKFLGIPHPHIVTAGQVLEAVTVLAKHLGVNLRSYRNKDGVMEWTATKN